MNFVVKDSTCSTYFTHPAITIEDLDGSCDDLRINTKFYNSNFSDAYGDTGNGFDQTCQYPTIWAHQ